MTAMLIYLMPLFLFKFFQPALSDSHIGACHYAINVTNDGPVTLDVPITLIARLHCADNETDFLYVFRDDEKREIRVLGHDTATASFVFTEQTGRRNIEVTAYPSTHPYIEVATADTSFDVQDYIPGLLNLTGIVEDKDGHWFVETGSDTKINLHLQYPSAVLRDSEFAYSWRIGEDRYTTDRPFIVHRFNEAGPQWVRVSVVGRIPSYDKSSIFRYKWGYFDADITVKDPFYGINISGNTYLEHGQLLDLDISCNGSGPVEYCWKVLPTVTENNTNLSCTDPVTVTDCSFPILYYFRDSGDYLLAIYVNNLISSLQRNIEVHIYDVSLRPQLSTVIIPLACTVLVVIIIAGAVIIHMRRHTNFDIETADFDFLRTEESTTVAVETSWELMRRSLLHLLQLRCLCYATEGAASSVSYGSILVGMER